MKLKDALAEWDSLDMDELMEPEATFVSAARILVTIDPLRLDEGLKFAHITDSDGDYLKYVATQVAAALGITEDIQSRKCRHGFTNIHMGANGEWACAGLIEDTE